MEQFLLQVGPIDIRKMENFAGNLSPVQIQGGTQSSSLFGSPGMRMPPPEYSTPQSRQCLSSLKEVPRRLALVKQIHTSVRQSTVPETSDPERLFAEAQVIKASRDPDMPEAFQYQLSRRCPEGIFKNSFVGAHRALSVHASPTRTFG
jgi:hypothetical protein